MPELKFDLQKGMNDFMGMFKPSGDKAKRELARDNLASPPASPEKKAFKVADTPKTAQAAMDADWTKPYSLHGSASPKKLNVDTAPTEVKSDDEDADNYSDFNYWRVGGPSPAKAAASDAFNEISFWRVPPPSLDDAASLPPSPSKAPAHLR